MVHTCDSPFAAPLLSLLCCFSPLFFVLLIGQCLATLGDHISTSWFGLARHPPTAWLRGRMQTSLFKIGICVHRKWFYFELEFEKNVFLNIPRLVWTGPLCCGSFTTAFARVFVRVYKMEEHLDKGESSADLFVPSERLIIIINLMRVANYPQQIADERRRPRKKYFDRLSAEVVAVVGSTGGGEGGGKGCGKIWLSWGERQTLSFVIARTRDKSTAIIFCNVFRWNRCRLLPYLGNENKDSFHIRLPATWTPTLSGFHRLT